MPYRAGQEPKAQLPLPRKKPPPEQVAPEPTEEEVEEAVAEGWGEEAEQVARERAVTRKKATRKKVAKKATRKKTTAVAAAAPDTAETAAKASGVRSAPKEAAQPAAPEPTSGQAAQDLPSDKPSVPASPRNPGLLPGQFWPQPRGAPQSQLDAVGVKPIEVGDLQFIGEWWHVMEALAECQGLWEPPTRGKEGQAGNRTYKYATLEQLFDATLPELSKRKVALTQSVSQLPDTLMKVRVTTVLTRGKGMMVSSIIAPCEPEYFVASRDLETLEFIGADDEDARLQPHVTPQRFGIAHTYARRYACLATLALQPEDDEDGSAQTRAPKGGGYKKKATRKKVVKKATRRTAAAAKPAAPAKPAPAPKDDGFGEDDGALPEPEPDGGEAEEAPAAEEAGAEEAGPQTVEGSLDGWAEDE